MENVEDTTDSNDEDNPIDRSILLQFAKFSKGYKISDFDDFIQEHIGVDNLEFFGRLAYPNQWQMRVNNAALREELIRIGRTRIMKRSCWMRPLNQQEIRGFVHWLPNSVTNEQLEKQLEMYGKVQFVRSEKRSVRGTAVESDTRYYGLLLPHETMKEDLPHFLKINNFMCLVIVRGRAPACFHCKTVGHRRTECQQYQDKLASYCNREPDTAEPRLRPRGRRHVKKTPVPETATEIEIESLNIFEALDQIIRNTTETLGKTFANFEHAISQAMSRSKLLVDRKDQERDEFDSIGFNLAEQTDEGEVTRTEFLPPVETSAEGFTSIKQTEDATQHAPVTLEQTEQAVAQAFEKMEKHERSETEIFAKDYIFDKERIQSISTQMQIGESASATPEETSTKIVETAETASEVPIIELDPVQSAIETLKQTQKEATEFFNITCRELEEKIAEFATPMAAEGSSSDTNDEVTFIFQTLRDAETIARKTFGKLDERIATEFQRIETIEDDSTKLSAVQLQQDILETLEHFEKEDVKTAVESEQIERESIHVGTLEEILEPSMHSSPPIPEGSIPQTGVISESNLPAEEMENEIVLLESKVSNAVQAQTNDALIKTRNIFSSIFAEAAGELAPEARKLLKQVESKVSKMVEETQVSLKTEMAQIFAPSREIRR